MAAPAREEAPRILLVEDSQDVVDLITLALVRHGWRVEAAARAEEALERLAEARHFDLVICHLNLPDRVATSMLREARDAGLLETTSVLIITGQANANVEDYPVLKKPLDIEALVRQAATILEASGMVPPVVGGTEVVELVLYYTPPWPSSMKARRNLEKILAAYLPESIHLTIRDLGEHASLAESDGVVFSPTLIKKSPGAPVWMLGDLSDSRAVTDLLLASGIRPQK
jgi:DNA-binding response OmpR family regulator